MIKSITTLKDVEEFAYTLASEGLTIGFHPDNPFEEYIDSQGKPVYSEADSVTRNNLMDQCFEVCDREGVDIYEFMGRIQLKGTPAESIFDKKNGPK